MLKRDEMIDPTSCLNKARDDERLFVLLGRDRVAPNVIRHWCHMRVLAKLNRRDDPQIVEALECARLMEAERETPTEE